MINYLIVTATKMEIMPLLHFLDQQALKQDDSKSNNNIKSTIVPHYQYIFNDTKIDVLITGIGLLSTCFHLTRVLYQQYYSEVIHIGVAGSYLHNIQIGDLVYIKSQEIGDLGAEDGTQFIPIKQMNFWDAQQFPYQHGILHNNSTIAWSAVKALPKVKGISVNKVTGNTQTIAQMKSLHQAEVECMEGAAVFYCCLMHQQSFHEVRAISNYVTPRNKADWNMTLAIERLNCFLIALLKE